jgi:hypothetical protein
MIEALACGTPVIALRAGSVPEVMEHGVTGYSWAQFAIRNRDDLCVAVAGVPGHARSGPVVGCVALQSGHPPLAA